MADTMHAAVRHEYGSPDAVELQEVDRPVPASDQLLVRVRAASVNALDWHYLTGTPYLMRMQAGLRAPKDVRLGVDFAGTVDTVGAGVTRFAPGDEVYGGASGAFAEYLCVREAGSVARKPAGVTFEQAASVPIAAITALQGLRDHGKLQAGQKVLVNGASGGVGTFAIQIAKALGAEVTGVCSTGKVDLVRSLGADHVIDYTREDFARNGQRYDLVLSNAGSRPWSAYRRVLNPTGALVMAGGPKTNSLIGPFGYCLRVQLAARLRGGKASFFLATIAPADLEVMRELLETGKVKPAIEKRYQLDGVADALRYLGQGHAKGKLVIAV
jgi:NADPH:quinone reductase-like Zn-dependent oxidoreductase